MGCEGGGCKSILEVLGDDDGNDDGSQRKKLTAGL
jgi:hypothetical protein